MVRTASLAFELLLFSFLWIADGRSEVLSTSQLDSRTVKDESTVQCDSSILDFETNAILMGNNIDVPLSIPVHRNGEPEACGSSPFSIKLLDQALQTFTSEACPKTGDKLSKYFVESLLTELFRQQLQEGQCESMDTKKNPEVTGFLGFCDMGPDRTVPQPDSRHLIPVPSGSLPCRFFTREGVRISSIEMLVELVANSSIQEGECLGSLEGQESTETCLGGRGPSKTLDLYAVPAGRVFMFAPKYVGEIFELPHVLDKDGNQLSLKVLSLNPRVFDIFNFFSTTEAQQLIDNALRETSETHKLHRSTTGTVGANVINTRTSENAWDTNGVVAQTIKKRCMAALGFDAYYESHTDGLQILRYNLTTAYASHMDYLDDVSTESYDYRSEGRGGNRFATILLYMSDLEENWGGETLFTKGVRVGAESQGNDKEMVRLLRERGEIDVLQQGSWEERMTAKCRTRLSVRPQKSRAVLFYSQFPNGTEDKMSEHGGCPVLQGTKWAANLWVWNAARGEFEHAPFKLSGKHSETRDGNFELVTAVFSNSGKNPKFKDATLFWGDDFFAKFGAGEEMTVNTYVSHVWNVKDPKGNTLHTWTIKHASTEEQYFYL